MGRLIEYGGRRQGKSLLVRASIEYAHYAGKTIAIGTNDHGRTAAQIAKWFPGALCEVRGSWLVPKFRKHK